ncbi:AraC family transcriptional regulator [Paenibacillus sp. GD4]|jgi:AraC-like DNA-binding protein|uniref:helix-turn-helix transcriptional regulator n=1 Tax=Paenibacillus sp. GD4 TaxID=3068890 RepID=UPI00279642A7|nr:AraC family transcriptional regulator [Paenibacillus sp. GD4]MDQ1910089.1 AraC family transcriptional regulator [Paenibacillus sp. GD4]
MVDCLQLRIPPLPQFLTGGHSVWPVGMQHFERIFEVYDLLLVFDGTMYMTEEDKSYSIRGGELLLLEPGRRHVGLKPCEEPTDIYWVHFKHELPHGRLQDKQVEWSVPVRAGRDQDLTPQEQFLYLPKYGAFDRTALKPILDELLQLRSTLTMDHAVDIQVLLGRLLSALQSSLRSDRRRSRSYAVAEQVMRYLEARTGEGYQAGRMAEELHFDEDYAARCLRKHYGMSPLQYHNRLRMEEAKRLLRHSTLALPEIASLVGYGDYNYFIRMFRKTVGSTPGAYRNQAQGYV